MDSKDICKPMTAAERQRKRRQKMKDEGTYEMYKKKHLEEVRKSRKKQKEALLKLPKSTQNKIQKEKRMAVRKHVAAFRAKKKELKNNEKEESTPTEINYSASALGKATARARRNLPSSPRRKEAVIRRLYSLDVCKNGISPEICEISPQVTKLHSSSISPENVELIVNFYQRDDISRQAPGRKDSITVRQEGKKSKVQVRHLFNSIAETFNLFQEDHPDVKIGRSKFADIRPKHVLPCSKLPHNVCLCKYHENFIQALFCLHQAYPDTFPIYSSKFPETIICEPPQENCWYNTCEKCKNGLGFKNKYIEDANIDIRKYVTWFEWKKGNEDHIQKVKEEGSLKELILYVCKLAPTFLEHCYVKRHQAREYRKYHELLTSRSEDSDLDHNIALIQVDFSENYTCKYQDEIQSAHWQQKQVSLFTAAIWHSGMFYPYVLASDNTTHAKETVIAYIDRLLENLPNTFEEIIIWSDGPASQFKNCYVAAALCELQKKYNSIIKWNFFATSHGKGPVDGIGGSVKRQVWGAVNSRKHIVVDATSFVEAANATSKVTVSLVTCSEIDNRNKTLKLKKLFKTAQAVPNISKIHQLVASKGKLTANKLSNYKSLSEEEPPKVGDWYFVEYQNKLYPGEIKTTDYIAEEYQVETMEAIGKYWKWPNKRDLIFYTKDKLMKKLGHPIAVNARGHFKFD